MSAQHYCEVALPVPLRSTFTYAVPGSNGESLVGRRVVVPFRKRAMIGVAIAESDRAPENAAGIPIKPIAEMMDSSAALAPKLIELGCWISRYYLAPIGETFRAMLPPDVQLRQDREYSLTDAGRGHLAQFALTADEEIPEGQDLALLRHFDARDSATSAQVRRWLYLAALRWLRQEPVRSWYVRQKARRRGEGKAAVVGVMRKLALALYQVAGRGETFDRHQLYQMLTSAALVLMMTGPGLALFYGGLVRRKNTLAIMMQSFALMALITVMWALVGYSLCFGGSGPVIGGGADETPLLR